MTAGLTTIASFAVRSVFPVAIGGLPSKLTKTSGTVHCKSKRSAREGDPKMINLDRFGGVTEPEDGVQSEIDDREAELKDLRAQLAELMAG